MKRRNFVYSCLATPLVVAGTSPLPRTTAAKNGTTKMYGLISQIKATDGSREKLTDILLRGTQDMPGCKLYAVAADAADATGVWITEIWDSQNDHQASLQLPGVQKAMAEGKPLIAGFGARHVVTPLGGMGVG